MTQPRLKDNQKLGYICLDCGEEIFDNSHNPYTDRPVGILSSAVRMDAIIHCLNNGCHRLQLRDTDVILTVGD